MVRTLYHNIPGCAGQTGELQSSIRTSCPNCTSGVTRRSPRLSDSLVLDTERNLPPGPPLATRRLYHPKIDSAREYTQLRLRRPRLTGSRLRERDPVAGTIDIYHERARSEGKNRQSARTCSALTGTSCQRPNQVHPLPPGVTHTPPPRDRGASDDTLMGREGTNPPRARSPAVVKVVYKPVRSIGDERDKSNTRYNVHIKPQKKRKNQRPTRVEHIAQLSDNHKSISTHNPAIYYPVRSR